MGMKKTSIRTQLFLGMMSVIVGFLVLAAVGVAHFLNSSAEEASRLSMERARDAYDRFSKVEDSRLADRVEGLVRDVLLARASGDALGEGSLSILGARLAEEPFFVIADLEQGKLLDFVASEFDADRLRSLTGFSRLAKGRRIREVWSYGDARFQVVATPLVVERRMVGFIALGNRLGDGTAEAMAAVSGHDVLLVKDGELIGSATLKGEGEASYALSPHDLFQAMPRSFEEEPFHTLKTVAGDYLLFRVPMDANSTDLIMVHSLREAHAQRANILMLLGIGTLLMIGFAFVASQSIATRLAGPISDLSRAATQLAGGDLTAQVDAKGDSEVARLGAAFNRMAQKIHLLVDEALERAKASEQASTTKSAFLANMSHELRTPLNGIIGFSELVLADELSESVREKVGLIHRSGDDLLTIVNDLLDFSKIEAGQMELDHVELNLAELMERACDPLRPGIKEKGLAFGIEIDERVPDQLIGPAVRLQQIVRNYLSNAFKFTDSGGLYLTVTLVEESAVDVLIRTEVRDTGRGIPEGELERLFQAFAQVENTGVAGTGLGLAICKELAEMMQGEVGAKSELGQGSSFWFTARIEKSVAERNEPKPRAPLPSTKKPDTLFEIDALERQRRAQHRLLVVEDHPVNQRMVKLILDRSHWPHEIVDNGQEAIERFDPKEFDLILMDCQMPVMDGYETTGYIRAEEREGERVPIIALTANTMAGDRERCLAAGMDDFVGKPIRAAELLEKLEAWLSEKV